MKNGRFIPEEIYQLHFLSWTERILLVEIGQNISHTDTYLSTRLGVSKQTITTSLNKFVRRNLIRKEINERGERRLHINKDEIKKLDDIQNS